jgi:hypothetical protein
LSDALPFIGSVMKGQVFSYSAQLKQTIVPEHQFLIIILWIFRQIVLEEFFLNPAPNGRVSDAKYYS